MSQHGGEGIESGLAIARHREAPPHVLGDDLGVGDEDHRWGVDDDESIALLDLAQQVLEGRAEQNLVRPFAGNAHRVDVEARLVDRVAGAPQLGARSEHVVDSHLRVEPERLANARAAEIEIDEGDVAIAAERGQRQREVGRDGGLAFVAHCAHHGQASRARRKIALQTQGEVPERLRHRALLLDGDRARLPALLSVGRDNRRVRGRFDPAPGRPGRRAPLRCGASGDRAFAFTRVLRTSSGATQGVRDLTHSLDSPRPDPRRGSAAPVDTPGELSGVGDGV